MSWMVTQDQSQFSVPNLDDLKRQVADGRLAGHDMVRRPGAKEWNYVQEIPELAALLSDTIATDDDDLPPRRSNRLLLLGALSAFFLAVIGVGLVGIVLLARTVPTTAGAVVGDGGMTLTQMLVTEHGAPLRSSPDAASATVTALAKDSTVELLAKRGPWYRARTVDGNEGWVATGHVVPAYQLAGGDAALRYDPLYNPDRYIAIANVSWLQLDQRNEKLTVFRFVLENESQYPMTDIVLQAAITDTRGTELERVEIAIEGTLPKGGSTMVGTLAPDAAEPDAPKRLLTAHSFEALAATDPDLQLRFSDGVEVEMTTTDFTGAQITLLQARAIPPDNE
jgi:hypothetical protein